MAHPAPFSKIRSNEDIADRLRQLAADIATARVSHACLANEYQQRRLVLMSRLTPDAVNALTYSTYGLHVACTNEALWLYCLRYYPF